MKKLALVFLSVLIAIVIVYWRAPIQFLRAESGWYLAKSHADEATERDVVRGFFTTSYGGHYTPLAFLAEFETAKLAGPSRNFWRWRQFVALAFAGTALFFAAHAVAVPFLEGRATDVIAAGFAAVAIFQPAMLDLVSWPFMVMQLAWCSLSLAAIYCVARVPAQPRPWTLLALAAAYASLHVSGLGVVTLAGTTAALLVLRAPLRDRAVGALAGLAALHICAMIWLLPRGGEAHPAVSLVACSKLLLGFLPQFAFSGLRSFLGLAPDEPSPFAVQYSWPIGVLLIVGVIAGIMHAAKTRGLIAALVCSSAVSFLILATMIGVRMIQAESSHAVATNLAFIVHAPRYVVPLHITLVPVAVSAVLIATRRSLPAVSLAALGLMLAVTVAQFSFQRTAYLYLDRAARVSHYSVWRLIVATARQCRAANLPLPNVPLDAVTREFSDWDPQMFVAVLKAEERAPLISWRDYLARDRAVYEMKVPALRELERRLGVEEN